MLRPHLILRCVTACLLIAAVFASIGCNWAAYVANAAGGGDKMVDVAPQYTRLGGKRIAVLVATDPYLHAREPDATLNITRAMSVALAQELPDATLVAPTQLAKYMEQNPYWFTAEYDRLAQELNVDRLVIVDVAEYRNHEPGNQYIWQGTITAHVGVYEAGTDANRLAFAAPVSAVYPQSSVGYVEGSAESIEAGTLALFTRDAAGLFYKHQVPEARP